jgi:uncharacterized protein (DUF1697 family)
MAECIALIRGINVGRARRISMSDLRELFAGLGHRNVRTLLNSGNVLFQSPRPSVRKLARAVEDAISAKRDFSTSVIVLTAAQLAKIVHDNPLLHLANDPARHLVAFAADPDLLVPLRALLKESWSPEAIAISSRAAYLWCASGILDGKLSRAFARNAGDKVTTRNWATVLKLHSAANVKF